MSVYERVPPHGRIVLKCPYCGNESRLTNGAEIYPHRQDLYAKNFYLCDNPHHDRAFVGCHPNTITPLGRLADSHLRKDKSSAHAAFDPIWRDKHMKRQQAYKWLAEQLGIDFKDCHIGMFDRITCRKVVALANEYMEQRKRA